MACCCQLTLSLGLLIALGIFTKTALWHGFGEYVITLPHVFFNRLGISRDATGKLFSLILILLSLKECLKIISKLGGFTDTLEILLSLSKFREGVNKPLVDELIANFSSLLVWTFILEYYVTQQELHRKILEMQEEKEGSFVLNNCSQFRQEFMQ